MMTAAHYSSNNGGMAIFLLLLQNLLPLYLLIAVGFFGGRVLNLERQTLANMAIYLCAPVVTFGFVAGLDLKPAYALLPAVTLGISALVAIAFLHIGRRVYGDNRANLLTMCASMGNTGYFGLPVALALFDRDRVGVYMFMLIGGALFEATMGYYIAARGKFTVRESLARLARFPALYAVAAGLAVNAAHVRLPDLFQTYWGYFKGAYVILGMMIIGAALSRVEKFTVAPQFTALAFAGKFLAWPLLTGLFVVADRSALHLFDPDIHRLLCLFAIVPPGANIAAYAAQMDLRPEKAATTILLGTVFALIYIPLVMGLFAP
jgi:predicted permease